MKDTNELEIKKFYFVRHGATNWNMRMLNDGPQDLNINQDGINRATCTYNNSVYFIKSPNFICSPLKRCKDTLNILSENIDCTITIDTSISERYFGDWSVIKPKISALFDVYKDQNLKYADIQDVIEQNLPLDAESKNAFYDRIRATAHNYLVDNFKNNMVFVAHGCVKTIFSQLLNVPDISLEYGGMCKFEFHGDCIGVNSSVINFYENL